MKTKHIFWALGLAVLFAGSLRAASVNATLDTNESTVGQPAQLTVTVTGSQEQPAIPSVDGLDITLIGQSTQVEIVNGSMTANVCDTYQVMPQREGTFVIPAIHAGGAASQPITLRVGKGSATAAAPGQGPVANPSLPAPAVTSNQDDTAAAGSQGRFGSLQVVLSKKDLYVGELVPVDVKAYIPDQIQATINDLPQMTSDAFAMNPLSTKMGRSSEVIDGRGYTVLTWHTTLTAVKAGDYSLSMQMPITVIVPQQVPQSMDDPNFNNFFRNAFAQMGMGEKKEINLQSDPAALKVQSLPTANRPADFSGAVGQFEVETSAAPTQVNAGDPITLRLKVTGEGNFDRVSSNMLAADSHWKTYSPKTHFEPADSVGYKGELTIEQPVIPNDASVTAIPSLSFSFFDPETRQYVTRTTAPIACTVTGSASSPSAPSVAAAGNGPASSAPAVAPTPAVGSDLAPNKVEIGSTVSTLRPLFLNPWFIAGQGLPIVALVAGLGFLRRHRLASDPAKTRATAAERAIRQQLDAMDEAMRRHDAGTFFIHARSALQQRFGQEWNMRPETITLADVEARLGGDGGNVRPIFEMADQASYSDLHFEDADLREWREAVVNELPRR